MIIDEFKIKLSLGLTSAAVLSYEILVIRVFSILFRMELLFLMLSLSLLGLGLGGIISGLLSRYRNSFTWYVFSFPAVMGVTFLMVSRFSGRLKVTGTIIWGVLPFLVGGAIITSLYKRLPHKSGNLYLFDLLGATTGILSLLLFTNLLGVPGSAYVPMAAAAAVPFLFFSNSKSRKHYQWLPISIVILLILIQPWAPLIRVSPAQLKKTNTPLGETLNYPRFKAKWIKSHWDVYSRCDLVDASMDGTKKSIFINGGSEAQMFFYDGRPETEEKLKKDILYFPYMEKGDDQVLILGAGGGRDVLMAYLGGASRIDAVEINQGVIDCTKEEKEFNGDVFSLKGVNLQVTDARTFLMRSQRKYDRIVMNLSSTYAFSDIAALGQLESYLYTMEAFQLYFDHLTENGVLTIFINYPKLAEKFMHSVLEHFHKQGLPYHEASRRMIAFAPSDWSYLLMFAKKPFKVSRVDKIKSLADRKGVRLLFLPYYWIDYSKSSLAEQIFTDFNLIASARHLPSEYRKASQINLEPVTDNQPYFLEVVYNHRSQLKHLTGILSLMLLVLSAVYLSTRGKKQTPKLFMTGHSSPPHDEKGWLPPKEGDFPLRDFHGKRKISSLPVIFYFIFVGISFMMVELSFIKMFSFYFGYPQLTLSVVLIAILLGAGLGGNFFTDSVVNHKYKVPAAALILALILAIAYPAATGLIKHTVGLQIVIRCFLAGGLIFIPSFLMGIFFPAGLKAFGANEPEEIPWFWGVNGIASVTGSVLAALVAITHGFKANLELAAVFYLLAGLCFRIGKHFTVSTALNKNEMT